MFFVKLDLFVVYVVRKNTDSKLLSVKFLNSFKLINYSYTISHIYAEKVKYCRFLQLDQVDSWSTLHIRFFYETEVIRYGIYIC